MMTGLSVDLKQKWDRVAQRLRAELGEDLYSSWFARMEIEECNEGRLAVSVPTRFLKSWIETHYLSRLHKTGESELGQIDAVHVRVRTRGLPVRPPDIRFGSDWHFRRSAKPQCVHLAHGFRKS